MQQTLQTIPQPKLTDVIGGLPQTQDFAQSHPIHYTSVLVNIFIFNYTISFTTPLKEARFNFYKNITTKFKSKVKDPKVIYGNYNQRGRVLSWRFSIHSSPLEVITFLNLLKQYKRIKLSEKVLHQITNVIAMMQSHHAQGIKSLVELRSTHRDGNPLGLLDGIHTTAITFVDDAGDVVERHRVFYLDKRIGATTHECAVKMFLACADVSTVSGLTYRDDLTHFTIHIKHLEAVISTVEEFGMKVSAIPPFGKTVLYPKGSCIFGVLIKDDKLTTITCHTSTDQQTKLN